MQIANSFHQNANLLKRCLGWRHLKTEPNYGYPIVFIVWTAKTEAFESTDVTPYAQWTVVFFLK